MKFFGKVGFWEEDVETSQDVWEPNIVEKKYFGDILQDNRRFQADSSQNDNFTVNNQISILSDLYAQQNWASIRYVEWNGTKWKVTSVEVTYPRLRLSIGGVWNENENQDGIGEDIT